jgi:hypothetical protein
VIATPQADLSRHCNAFVAGCFQPPHACGTRSSSHRSYSVRTSLYGRRRDDDRMSSSLAKTATNTTVVVLHAPANPACQGTPTAMLLSPRTRRMRRVVTLPWHPARPVVRRFVQVQGKTAVFIPIRASVTTKFHIQQRPPLIWHDTGLRQQPSASCSAAARYWCKKTWETTRKSLSGRKILEDSGSLFVWD